MASPVPAFTKRQQLLSPDQYELVDVRTRSGVRRAVLFPKLILQAEFAANATVRQRMAIKRERLRAKRAAKQETTVYRCGKSVQTTGTTSHPSRSVEVRGHFGVVRC